MSRFVCLFVCCVDAVCWKENLGCPGLFGQRRWSWGSWWETLCGPKQMSHKSREASNNYQLSIMDSRDCVHYLNFRFVDIIKVVIETVFSTLRPVEAMEDADKALAHNKLSTKAIIAKVSLCFFFKFMIYMTYFWRRRRSYNVWQLFVRRMQTYVICHF